MKRKNYAIPPIFLRAVIFSAVLIFIFSDLGSYVFKKLEIKNALAAPAYQAFSAIAASEGADVTVTLPSHAANDIFLIEVIVRDTNDTITWPSGWTQIATVDRGTTARYWWAWKRAASSSETNPLVDKSTSTGDTYAAVISYRGAITTGDPWEVKGTPQTGTNDPLVLTGITTLTSGALVVAAVAGEDNNNSAITTTGTDPSAYAEHYVESLAGSDGVITFSEAARTAAGATGNVSVDWNSAIPVGNGGILLALKSGPCVVTTTSDSGAGSLRQCITDINTSGGTTISFNIAGTNQSSGGDSWNRISISSGLPAVTLGNVTIDGTTQTTSQGNTNSLGPEIEIYCSSCSSANAFTLSSSNNVLKGVVIGGPFNVAVSITGNSNTVSQSYIGTDATGVTSPTVASGNKTAFAFYISGGASSNMIGGATAADRNILSGTSSNTIWLLNSTTQLNTIQNNYIGTTAAGTAVIPNAGPPAAVVLTDGTHDNTIRDNVISGNSNGIYVDGTVSDPTANVIKGNYIGTNAAGTAAIANLTGIYILAGANNTTIGGTTAADRNIISGNTNDGIYITDAGSDGTVITGNYIGTNAAATAAIANGARDIELNNGCANTTIGGSVAGAGNIISGGSWVGVSVWNSSNTTIYGNTIGTGPLGTESWGHSLYGVEVLYSGSSANIGGLGSGEGNVIANSGSQGIVIFSNAGANNVINGNTVRNNTNQGIEILRAGVVVQKNLVRNNSWSGIHIDGGANSNALVYHNTIHANSIYGFDNSSTATGSVVRNNIITGNGNHGFYVASGGSLAAESHNLVASNASYIPAAMRNNGAGDGRSNITLNANDIDGDPLYTSYAAGDFTLQSLSPAINGGCDLGAAGDNTWCDGASDGAQPDINGVTAGNYNDFAPDMGAYETSTTSTCPSVTTANSGGAGSLRDCIYYANSQTGANTITFTITGCPGGLCTIMPASALPPLSDGSGGTTIDGYTQSGASANTNAAPGALNTTLKVEIQGPGASSAYDGLTLTSASNVIKGLIINSFGSSSGKTGIVISGASATGNQILGNFIGTDSAGASALANYYGVLITVSASSTIVGTSTAADRNLFSGNALYGIAQAYSSSSSSIKGNLIGTNKNGTGALGNYYGLGVIGNNHAVGGVTAAERNVISGNTNAGIFVVISTGSAITGNYIGVDVNQAALGNGTGGTAAGINVCCSSSVTIGGTAAGAGNIIANSTESGINISSAGSQVIGNAIYGNAQEGIKSVAANQTISMNLIRNNGGTTYNGININTGATNNKLYHNTIHANGASGVYINETGSTIKNNNITGNAAYGINRVADSMTESYNDITDAATTPANASGRSNVSLDSTDLNANPLYVNAASGNFTLTECTSPAINAGTDLGADQPDTNGATAGLYNGSAPDMGAYETTCVASVTVTVGTTGTQTASLTFSSQNQYLGGTFTFIQDTGAGTVTQIILTETGTVNANANISGVKLLYKTEATCSSSIPSGTTAFNTVGANFNASERATVTGTMAVTTSQICVYVQVTISSNATDGQTLDIQIANPSTDVTVATGSVAPATAVAISGSTALSPAAGGPSSTLSLKMADPAKNPTVFSLSNGVLFIQEGTDDPIALTSSEVTVTSLQFTNLSYANSPGAVRIQITIQSNNPSNRQEYTFSQTFYTSATIRKK